MLISLDDELNQCDGRVQDPRPGRILTEGHCLGASLGALSLMDAIATLSTAEIEIVHQKSEAQYRLCQPLLAGQLVVPNEVFV
jgi:hypothetical protein